MEEKIGVRPRKSTVAVNLALACAATGENVLLIDADRRARNVTRMAARGEDPPGFLDRASGRVEADQAIIKRSIYPIDILPVGSDVHLRSARLAPTVTRLARGYDLVVVDGGVPPRDRLVADLISCSSHILLIAREDVTMRAEYRSALDLLDRSSKVHPVLLTDR